MVTGRMVNKKEKMKRLLMKSDFTVSELAGEAGCPASHASRAIKKWVKEGMVEIVAFRDSCKNRPAYTWCGDDDIHTIALRAADFLRDQIGTEPAKHLAQRIFEAAA